MPVLDLFWAMLLFFLHVAWLAALVAVVADILVNRETRGFAKALWILLVILIPWLGVLMYLLVHGHGTAERSDYPGFASRRTREATSVHMFVT